MNQQASQQTQDLMKDLISFSQGWQDGIQQRLKSIKESLEESQIKMPKLKVPVKKEEVHPLITALELYSISGQSLKVHVVEPGEPISYEKDINAAALVIHEDGKTIETVTKGNRVFPAEFTLIGKGETEEEQIKDILVQEDNLFIQLLKAASCIDNTILPFTNFYGKILLEDVMQQVERHHFLADKFIINRSALGDCKKSINAIDYDTVSSKDLKEGKLFASIWGVNIFVYDSFPDEEAIIFAVTSEIYLGKRAIRSVGIDASTGQLKLCGSMYISNAEKVACGAYHKLLNIKFE